jgi:hypothetical protein
MKHQRIARAAADYGTAEMPLDSLRVMPRLVGFHAPRQQPRPRPMPSRREQPDEAAIDQNRRLGLLGEKPTELDTPLFIILFLKDLVRASELLVTSHLKLLSFGLE